MDIGTLTAIGAWLWKEFGKDFLLWSKDIIKRKYIDAKETEKKLLERQKEQERIQLEKQKESEESQDKNLKELEEQHKKKLRELEKQYNDRLDTIQKQQLDSIKSLEKNWENFNWELASERYKKHMREIYGHIRVIGTTEPVDLDNIFTDVYLLEKPEAYKRFDISKLNELQEEPEQLSDDKRLRGLQVVVQDRAHRLYILGKPGAGKTTFLNYLLRPTM